MKISLFMRIGVKIKVLQKVKLKANSPIIKSGESTVGFQHEKLGWD